MIQLPVQSYNLLLKACDVESREHTLLINGCWTRFGKGEGEMRMDILCELEQAELLLQLANQISPAIAATIVKSFDFDRKR